MVEQLRFTFGKNLKALRQASGLTQQNLAYASDIDHKYLQKIESKNPPNVSLKIIERLAKALKTTPSKLLNS